MFIRVIRKSSVLTLLLLLGCAAAAWALLSWPQAAAAGISRGLSICSTVIIPSLFPFLVLAGFLVKSGVSAAIGRRLEKPTRRLFALPGCCAAGILLGLFGGYPAGAVAAGELVRQGAITQNQGRRMLMFCVNGGPAFILSAVGAGMLGSVKAGVLLYIAHVAASLLLGVLFGLGAPKEERHPPTAEKGLLSAPRVAPHAAFVDAVTAACRTLLAMCGFILLFAAVLSVLDGSGLPAAVGAWAGGLGLPPAMASVLGCLLPGLLEVSCGSIEAATTGAAAPLMLGLVLGWGGLSVHCQIAATLRDQALVTRRFFGARLLHALLGGALSVVLFRCVPVEYTTTGTVLAAFNPGAAEVTVSPFATSAVTSAALLFLCALFLLTVNRRNGQRP